jgi:integrase
LLERLGIPRGGFHSIRHGVASALLADGVTPAVVQRQLRHSHARTTLGIYGHVVGGQQRPKVDDWRRENATRALLLQEMAHAAADEPETDHGPKWHTEMHRLWD